MTRDGQGMLADAWETDAGPRRLLYVHETEFRSELPGGGLSLIPAPGSGRCSVGAMVSGIP